MRDDGLLERKVRKWEIDGSSYILVMLELRVPQYCPALASATTQVLIQYKNLGPSSYSSDAVSTIFCNFPVSEFLLHGHACSDNQLK